ncbi:MAG: phage holin family protein [Steroidobacteraceae bacterium]
MSDAPAPGPVTRLLDSTTRLAGTLLEALGTRLDLLATEAEEDAGRALRILGWGAVSLFAGMGALMFAGLAVVALFRDTHPALAALGVAAFFVSVALAAAATARRWSLAKPRLLDATRTELARDVDALRGRR